MIKNSMDKLRNVENYRKYPGNVFFSQYDDRDYPLKRYTIEDIPLHVLDSIYKINELNLATFRGGVSYILITNSFDYELKDIDMISNECNKEQLIAHLDSADAVYINKNTLGECVITAFWKSLNEYYKLDVLLSATPYTYETRKFNGRHITTLSASYIWSNRIVKISEKALRNHNDEKTINHFRVARSISCYLMDNKGEISENDIRMVMSRMNEVRDVLSKLVEVDELSEFMRLQEELIKNR